MDLQFSSGGPFVHSYTDASCSEPRQQSGCIPDFAFAKTDRFYQMSSGSQQQQHQEQQELEQQQRQQQTQAQHNQHISGVYSFPQGACHPPQPHVSSNNNCAARTSTTSHLHFPTVDQPFWPSPPLAPCDVRNHCPPQGSPTPGVISEAPCYSLSSNSPGSWSSPGSIYPHPPTEQFHQQQQQQSSADSQAFIRICTPQSVEDFPLSSPYPTSFQQGQEQETFGLQHPHQHSPGMNSEVPVTMACSLAEQDGQLQRYGEEVVETGAVRLGAPNGAKNDEPYAKLIYKAFMSRPDYAMTLQDIYQWFRDNTSKAVNERGGWQNSIRHNLSMNAAFKRRDRVPGDGSAAPAISSGSPSATGGDKRTFEWVLEDWAIRDGVQSTTRYRKGNSGRRANTAAGGARSTSYPYNVGSRTNNSNNNNNRSSSNGSNGSSSSSQYSSTRAVSGRKGGCAARNSRLRGQQYNEESAMGKNGFRLIERGLDSPPRTALQGPYFAAMPQVQVQADYRNGASFHLESSAAESFGLGLQMVTPSMGDGMTSGDGHGSHGGIPSVSYNVGHHQDPAYLAPSPDQFPYNIEDVQLDYAQRSTGVAGPERLFDDLPGSADEWQNNGM